MSTVAPRVAVAGPRIGGLAAVVEEVRARAKGPVKVSMRTRENVSLQYTQGPGRTWVLHGKSSLLNRRWRKRFATTLALDKYLRKLQPLDVQIRPREPKIVAIGRQSGDWRIDLCEVGEIARLVGKDVFAAFMRCFVGVDRLKSLLQFYVGAKEKFGEIRPAADRNFHTSWLMLVGAMHELGEALQALNSTKVHLRLPKRSRWRPLEKLRKQWYVHPVVSRIRNQAHHIGRVDDFERGIEELTDRCLDTPLRMGQGKQRINTIARCAWDIQFLGFSSAAGNKPELELTQIKKVVRDAGRAHNKVHDALEAYFLQVAEHAGVRITGNMTE